MHVTVIGDLVVDVCSHCSFVTHYKVVMNHFLGPVERCDERRNSTFQITENSYQ